MAEVSIVKCQDYEYGKVKDAVRESVNRLGGMQLFVKPGEKVLLKVNLLIRSKPERAVTTHPSLAFALAELVKEAGGHPIIGDSPGGYHFYTRNVLETVYDTCGMTEAAAKSGAELNFNTEVVDVPYPEGRMIKSVKTIKPVLDVDKIINICKIKTHMMTVYSGAVKNLFGIIPGSYKAEYHLRFEDTTDFADLLIDLCMYAKPVLTVMDAVFGMEGYGPTNGTPRKVGLIISGTDPFALDAVAAKIIGLDHTKVPTIRRSVERGLYSGNFGDVRIKGEKLEDVAVPDFKKPTVKIAFNYYDILLPRFITKRFDRWIKPRPIFDHKVCKKCGMCKKSCPPGAIELVDGRPVADMNLCIKCFCCHELCRYNAVKVKRPWFLKLLLR